jgi:hypothetical protein
MDLEDDLVRHVRFYPEHTIEQARSDAGVAQAA